MSAEPSKRAQLFVIYIEREGPVWQRSSRIATDGNFRNIGMAYQDGSNSPYFANPSPTSTSSERRWSLSQRDEKGVNEQDLVQGRILWLPPKHELPVKAVRRAHGKGAVEEGIYNHPVVIISRPADDKDTIHFHLVSSGFRRGRQGCTHKAADNIISRQEAP